MNDRPILHSPYSLGERFPQRATTWQLPGRVLTLPARPRLMGIVNVTPDSFSDGGAHLDVESAIAHGLSLVQQGADLLDIGGESTRPYATPVGPSEESRRVLPVIRGLAARTDVPISVDTSKACVAAEAITAGASIINDVTGLTGDPDMPKVAMETGAGLCLMHMQGTPQTMQQNPTYRDVVEEVFECLRRRRDGLVERGISVARICLDVGIGFGKTHQHNIDLLAAIGRFHELGCPLLVGHSRKGFLAKLLADKQADRTQATVGVGLAMAAAGVQLLRVHDVRPLREALLGFEAVGGVDGTTIDIVATAAGETG
jgi:dihydropteroate synthase